MGARAEPPAGRPVTSEVQAVLRHSAWATLLTGRLLYGSGLPVNERLRLRVKDPDFGQQLLVGRDGIRFKDRKTMLPEVVMPALRQHLQEVRQRHHTDLQQGRGLASLPHALAKKYPNVNREWHWQYMSPSATLSRDPQSEDETVYRHHLHPSRRS